LPFAFALDTNTTYYWRVKSYSQTGDSTDWSDVFSFTTQRKLLPPALLAPANNSANISTSPQFSWQAVQGADFYIINIATNSNFQNIIKNDTVFTTSYSLSSNLSNNTTYYWRVRSVNNCQSSDWSAVFVFTTVASVSPQVTGSILYANSQQTPMNNCVVLLKNANNIMVGAGVTSSDGSFSIPNVPDGSYNIEIITSKLSGGLNLLDVLLVRRFISGLISNLSPIQLKAADVDNSNSVNILDVLKMRQKISGINVPSWRTQNYVIHPSTINVINGNAQINIQALCVGDVDGNYIPPNN